MATITLLRQQRWYVRLLIDVAWLVMIVIIGAVIGFALVRLLEFGGWFDFVKLHDAGFLRGVAY